MKRTISIVGRGMDPAHHLTLRGLRALQSADKVVGIESESKTWKALQNEFGVPEIEDISHLYRSDARDLDNYERFIQYILDLTKIHPKLALLVAGHPRLGVTFLQNLPSRLPEGIELEVIEGISSLDVMLNDLALDPIERGACLLDVNRMLLFQYELEPSIAYFLYHICSVANSVTNYDNPSANNQLSLLQQFLLKTYSPDKEVLLCRASNGASESPLRIPIRLEQLAAAAEHIDFSTTMYIAPERPARLDREFLKLLN